MRPILALLLLLSTPALAEPRKPFPDDYKAAGPCASMAGICKSFNQSQFAEIAALRGFDIGQEWVDAHWKELTEALAPSCAKIATCFATPGNTPVFCNDLIAGEFNQTCDRYPEDSEERRKCMYFVRTFLFGHDRNSKEPWVRAQACAAATPPAGRKLEWWIAPEKIDSGSTGFTVFAIDSETRVPVRAKIILDVKKRIYASDSEDGVPVTFYPVPWKPRLARVPNASGHTDVVAPEVRIEAAGYETVAFRLPMDVPSLVAKIDPDVTKLRRGKNTVTVSAHDPATGAPVEARVMAGTTVLGNTNQPLELTIEKGVKRPEIWITSLYDRYSDVVVAPGEK